MVLNYLTLTKHYGEDIIFALFTEWETEGKKGQTASQCQRQNSPQTI